jgi:hypothetical protein
MLSPEELRSKLTKELDIENLPKEDQDAIISRLGNIVQERATLEVLKQLPPEKHDEFATIAEKGTPEEISEYLSQAIPNMHQIASDAIETEVQKYLHSMRQ